MNKLILHIPHSSKLVPKFFWDNVCVDTKIVNEFIEEITDTETDKLFGHNRLKKVKFNYSRVFCDVEKFVDDKKEVMSRFGMGTIYSRTNHGVLFKKYTDDYKQKILKDYYFPYHKKFNNIIKKMLNCNSKVIIIDCHSFSKEVILFEEKKTDLPDICLGINGQEDQLSKFIAEYFTNLKYKVKINYPYSGSMIPNGYIKNPNSNLKSIMLEINKDVYLYNKVKFNKLQMEINDLFKLLKSTNFD